MNNALHEQLLRPYSNTGLLNFMQNIAILMLQEVNLPNSPSLQTEEPSCTFHPYQFLHSPYTC